MSYEYGYINSIPLLKVAISKIDNLPTEKISALINRFLTSVRK